MKIGILEILSSAGKYVRKSGGEYAGPCPICGGEDRCCVWPDRGRWWCRQCGKGGDSVDLLKLRDGMSYRDACVALGVLPVHQTKVFSSAGRKKKVSLRSWGVSSYAGTRLGLLGQAGQSGTKPKCPADVPSPAWMEKAVAFLESCRTEAALSCSAAAVLYDRGFTLEGVRTLGIGFNPSTRWVPKSAWGVDGEGNLCLPAGIVLPVWRKAGLMAIEVRRFGQDAEKWGKYAFLQGGAAGLSHVHGSLDSKGVWLVMEGALDGFLALQEGKSHVAGFVACAGISKGISADALAFLRERPAVAIVPDSDKPGASGCARLQADIPDAFIVDVPVGKDLTEMHLNGVPLSAWAEIFLPVVGRDSRYIVPDTPCDEQAKTDTSTPENQTVGHDVPCQHTSTPLLAEIGRRGEYLLDDVMPIADAIGWLRSWWQRGINFAVRDEGVWLLLRREAAQQAERCLADVRAAWPSVCAALDIPRETSLCGWRRAEG